MSWKNEVLPGAGGRGPLPDSYRREGRLVGRAELLDATGRPLWSESELVGRAQTPHTTSAVEMEIKRRHLERLVDTGRIERDAPVLDLGCADGTFAHDLLRLGFERLVCADILHSSVARLDRSLVGDARPRVLLVVDDLLRLPLAPMSFGTVVAWGVLSLTGDFDRALDRAWSWVAPGGAVLFAEPLLEHALAYALVRGDLAELQRILAERTRAGMWDKREDRYPVNPWRFYRERLERLTGATVEEEGGINMLASLVLGGVVEDHPVDDTERAALSTLLADPALDELTLWRQVFWLVRKA